MIRFTCVGIYNELNFAKSNFVNTVNACNILKKGINNVMHPDKRGINVIFRMIMLRNLVGNLEIHLMLKVEALLLVALIIIV